MSAPGRAPLAGRVALVTGGGSGIGAATAEALAAAGAAVAVAGRREAPLAEVAGRIRAAGGRGEAVAADVRDEASVAAMVAATHERLGGLDVLVNNAGAAAAAPLERITLAGWNEMFAVNVTGAFLCTRAVLPAMKSAGFGRIVNVASVAGLAGARFIAHYAAAKHALVGLTRVTAAELAGSGVTANAVCPGYVDTAMTERTIEHVRTRTGREAGDALAAVLAAAGQSRLVAPAEVAAAVTALCEGGENGRLVVLAGGGSGDMPFEIVNPAALGEPRGWNNGLVAPAGARLLFVAGQAGWETGASGSVPGFAGQFARALDKVLAVVAGAGGAPGDVARLTVYVTELAAYRSARRELGAAWRERFGGYYPAMALVEVKGLVDEGALVEIEATAVLGGAR